MIDKWKNKNGKWDLEKIAGECINDLRKMGIPINKYIKISVCRNKYITGKLTEETVCWGALGFGLYIPNYYRNPQYSLEEIKAAIFHQLLHSIKDCMNHGETWQKYAKMVDAEYGCHITEQKFEKRAQGTDGDADSERCCYLDYARKRVEFLAQFLEECSHELKDIGLPIGKVSEIGFSDWNQGDGWCRRNSDNTYTIGIPQKYEKKDADKNELKRILCHQLLHTCQKGDANTVSYTYAWLNVTHTYMRGHDSKWREMARKIDREYGYGLMEQSYTGTAKKTSAAVLLRYTCPYCGGYVDVYNEKEIFEEVICEWCERKMNMITQKELDVLGTIYSLLGECQDKLRLAGIPIRRIAGVGFVSDVSKTGLHDNWNRRYSIDLPEIYNSKEAVNSDEFRSYLYKELIRTCEGCKNYDAKWEGYVRKAEEMGILI